MKTKQNNDGLLDVSRTVQKRDYSSETKEGERKFKEVTSYPSFTVRGKDELKKFLSDIPEGDTHTITVKLKCTGYSQSRDWDSESEEKIPEVSFDVLAMEVPGLKKKDIIDLGNKDPLMEFDETGLNEGKGVEDSDNDGDEENDTDNDGK